ncbi:MAG: ABC transporter substrate-binding protein [Firmicutes bacterium]|nr:ABC transporter substrate-binding protein [Bacillota bacterium]
MSRKDIKKLSLKPFEKATALISITDFDYTFANLKYKPRYLLQLAFDDVPVGDGFFEEEGLEITLDVGQGADKSMTALISGNADIALLGTEAGIYVYNKGKEDHAVAFAQLTQRAGNFLVSREKIDNFTWDNLKGKTIIGGRTSGMPEMILEYVLDKNGIEKGTDVELINNISFETTSGAFSAGTGDFTAEFEPSASALENAGKGYVVASLGEESGYVPYTVYMAQKSFIEENPDVIQKFTNAVFKGQKWVDEHSAQEIAEVIIPHFTESDVETITKIIDRYKAQDTWKKDPVFDKEGFTLIQDIMELSGELEKRVPFEEMINTSFAQNSIK